MSFCWLLLLSDLKLLDLLRFFLLFSSSRLFSFTSLPLDLFLILTFSSSLSLSSLLILSISFFSCYFFSSCSFTNISFRAFSSFSFFFFSRSCFFYFFCAFLIKSLSWALSLHMDVVYSSMSASGFKLLS